MANTLVYYSEVLITQEMFIIKDPELRQSIIFWRRNLTTADTGGRKNYKNKFQKICIVLNFEDTNIYIEIFVRLPYSANPFCLPLHFIN